MIPVLVVVPTWQRPEKLAACLASLQAQTYPNVEVLPVEDTDREFAFGIWNRIARNVGKGAFAYLCDDMEAAPDMIERAVSLLLSKWPNTDGLVGFRQNIQGLKGACDAAVGMIGARFLDRFPGRRPFCPEYSRFHADLELGRYAKKVHRFQMPDSVNLTHHHPKYEPDAMDLTHQIVRDEAAVARDDATLRRRKAKRLLWGTGRKQNLMRRRAAVRA